MRKNLQKRQSFYIQVYKYFLYAYNIAFRGKILWAPRVILPILHRSSTLSRFYQVYQKNFYMKIECIWHSVNNIGTLTFFFVYICKYVCIILCARTTVGQRYAILKIKKKLKNARRMRWGSRKTVKGYNIIQSKRGGGQCYVSHFTLTAAYMSKFGALESPFCPFSPGWPCKHTKH